MQARLLSDDPVVLAGLQAAGARAAAACKAPSPVPWDGEWVPPRPMPTLQGAARTILWRGEQVDLADFINVRMPPPPCNIYKFTRRLSKSVKSSQVK